MNSPHPITQQGMLQYLSPDLLEPSKTQPRTHFSQPELQEMAETIKKLDVLQPILVRKISDIDDRFEIVAGERRWRASQLAGLAEVPCFVRVLTDEQVLQAHVIENLQREDLHELEEAEGYERLMAGKDTDGNPYTTDKIAAEVGKSRAYVYGRLKLLALCAEARKAFKSGKIEASVALLIARIPSPKLQAEAAEEITKHDYQLEHLGFSAMSYRKARDLLQEKYMTDLDRAPFSVKDATLLPKAGSCIDCPKRTGNEPELFADVQGKNVCTDTACFALKKAAFVLALKKEADAKGHLVVSGGKAKKIIPNPSWSSTPTPSAESGYVRLDSVIPGDVEGRTYEKVLGKKAFEPAMSTGKPAVQKVLVENTHTHEYIPTINIEQATKALREMGIEVKLPSKVTGSGQDNAKQEKEKAAKKAKIEQGNLYRARLHAALRQKISDDVTGTNMNGLYCMLCEHHFSELNGYADNDDVLRLVKLYIPDIAEEVDYAVAMMELIPKMTAPQHFLLLIDIMVFGEMHEGYNPDHNPELMLEVAKEIGINAKSIEQEVAVEFKAAQKAAASEAKKAETPIAAPVAAKPAVRPAASWPFPTPQKAGDA